MPIRKMNNSDINEVLNIQQELQFQNWSEKQFISEIKAPYALSIVYENENKKIIGYAIFHLMNSDSELLTIAVKKTEQNKGIGSILLQEGINKLNFSLGDVLFLEVRESNLWARKFYEKFNFKNYCTRFHYYLDGENAILYKKIQ